MKIGETIKKLRKAKGISQMELADRIGITYQQLQKYEKGKSKITIERLIDIAKALDVPVSVFFHEVYEKERKFYSEDEVILIELYRKLSDAELKKALLKIMKELSSK
ncbi:helix-turn-helix transcriptional regulator [Thermodesulfovibrio sp. 3907-1M]|uniref:Helix-turn-helix transcriptional regulator n=1 Tax=Thermodesulfovibrio autotrophicus TaxID=3118333 RepID=A0AAU8GVG5_9BACT